MESQRWATVGYGRREFSGGSTSDAITVLGSTHLLDLRGGGQRPRQSRRSTDRGAGVAHWLEEDSGDEEPEVPYETEQEDPIQPTATEGEPEPANRNDSDAADEAVGIAAWEWLLDDPPVSSQAERSQGPPRPISLWEALYGEACTASTGANVDGPATAAIAETLPPVIRGKQGESEIVVCSKCQADVPTRESGWIWCQCGTMQCAKCKTLPCGWCEAGMRNPAGAQGLGLGAPAEMMTAAEWLNNQQALPQPFGRQLGPDGEIYEFWPEEQWGEPFDYGDLTSLEGGARQVIVHDGTTLR